MGHITYAQVVDLLRISQERITARQDRFEAFRRAVAFYASGHDIRWPSNCFLIAGTNGKGTVAKTLEVLLSTPGARVGLFTSPHLMEPTERIRVGGRDLTPDEMVRLYELVEPIVRAFDLSHFEILTLMMIEAFFGGLVFERVSVAVIEVGVGGRLDPTRVVPHQTAVLAAIGLDHEALLGPTLESIAREKLAVAEGATRLVFMTPPDTLRTVYEEARTQFAPCEFIEAREFPSTVREGREPRWALETPWGSSELALLGQRAVQNTSLALEALSASGIEPQIEKLSSVVWPGRMEKLIVQGREIYLSGDHNEQGVASLRDLLTHFDYDRLWLVIGVGKGKPVEGMLKIYRQIPRANLVLTMTSFRQMSADDFARLPVETKIPVALEAAEFALSKARPRDLVVVSGSLYLVGDLRASLLRRS